jgi:hypothetical protein
MFAFAAIGGVWTLVGLARRRPASPLALELTLGALVGWVGITETFVHDTRYSMPLLVYLAVFGSGWVATLKQRSGRLVAAGALVLIAIFNTLGASFGVGGNYRVTLAGARPTLLDAPGVLTIHTDTGFLVAAPHRDGDVLALMQALRRNGVRRVTWVNLDPNEPSVEATPDFSEAGLIAFALIAKLEIPNVGAEPENPTPQDAVLGHGSIGGSDSPPCTKLSDGTGVWVRLGNPTAPHAKNYCPFRRPAFY